MAFVLQPFDLLNEAPTRVKLLTMGGQEHVLMFISQHAITDGLSHALLQRDLAAAYTAVVAGHEPSWAPLPVQV